MLISSCIPQNVSQLLPLLPASFNSPDLSLFPTPCSARWPRRTWGTARRPRCWSSWRRRERRCPAGWRTRWCSLARLATAAAAGAPTALAAGPGSPGSPGRAPPRASSVGPRVAAWCKGAPAGTASSPRRGPCRCPRCQGPRYPWPRCLPSSIGSAIGGYIDNLIRVKYWSLFFPVFQQYMEKKVSSKQAAPPAHVMIL